MSNKISIENLSDSSLLKDIELEEAEKLMVACMIITLLCTYTMDILQVLHIGYPSTQINIHIPNQHFLLLAKSI